MRRGNYFNFRNSCQLMEMLVPLILFHHGHMLLLYLLFRHIVEKVSPECFLIKYLLIFIIFQKSQCEQAIRLKPLVVQSSSSILQLEPEEHAGEQYAACYLCFFYSAALFRIEFGIFCENLKINKQKPPIDLATILQK